MIKQFDAFSKKELKKVKRNYWHKIFAALTVFLFLFFIIFVYSSVSDSYGITFIFLTSFSLFISILFFIFRTKKFRLDIEYGKAELIRGVVEKKIYKLDYEPGSASVPVNLLSLLFFKRIFQREMKEIHICIIYFNAEKLYLEKEEFDKINENQEIIIRKTPNTNLFLGVHFN